MKHRRPGFALVTGIIAGIAQLSAISAFACGVEWKLPRNHFDGVNEYGFVSYWKEIGSLDIGDGVKFPLIIGFRSDWDRSSPYLGHGWLLGILDSHLVQRSADTFDLIQPDGYTVPFGRDSKNPSVLNGAKGWKAEIKGDTVAVYASCGWKLTFVKGKIASIGTPKNKIIDIQRDAQGLATALVNGTAVLMKIQQDAGGVATELLFGGKTIRLEKTPMPLIQSIGGVNVISAKDSAVGKIVYPSGEVTTFDYSPSEGLIPTMAVTEADGSPRSISWDAATRLILRDGSWNYKITPAEVVGHNAAIARTDSTSGQKQLWHYSQGRGEEITEKDGAKTVRKWFTSGKLNGKPRSVTSVKDGKETLMRSWSYDENGTLIRFYIQMNTPHVFTYKYNEAGKQSEVFVDGKPHIQKFYDEQGRLVKKSLAGGIVKTFKYTSQGIEEVITSDKGISKVRKLDKMFREIDPNYLPLSTSNL